MLNRVHYNEINYLHFVKIIFSIDEDWKDEKKLDICVFLQTWVGQ